MLDAVQQLNRAAAKAISQGESNMYHDGMRTAEQFGSEYAVYEANGVLMRILADDLGATFTDGQEARVLCDTAGNYVEVWVSVSWYSQLTFGRIL
jgi:hypothetical protein